jgi:hypothetical protein
MMARKINRLNARAVATIAEHGRHADGGGLYLSISPNGGRRWVFPVPLAWQADRNRAWLRHAFDLHAAEDNGGGCGVRLPARLHRGRPDRHGIDLDWQCARGGKPGRLTRSRHPRAAHVIEQRECLRIEA